jgi:hypothetical protein
MVHCAARAWSVAHMLLCVVTTWWIVWVFSHTVEVWVILPMVGVGDSHHIRRYVNV